MCDVEAVARMRSRAGRKRAIIEELERSEVIALAGEVNPPSIGYAAVEVGGCVVSPSTENGVRHLLHDIIGASIELAHGIAVNEVNCALFSSHDQQMRVRAR